MSFEKEFNLKLVLNQLELRIKEHRLLHFKQYCRSENMRGYKINDKLKPILKINIYNNYNMIDNKTFMRYEFTLSSIDENEDQIIYRFETTKESKDVNFIKSFFLDFYNLLLDKINIEDYYQLKEFFFNKVKMWIDED